MKEIDQAKQLFMEQLEFLDNERYPVNSDYLILIKTDCFC